MCGYVDALAASSTAVLFFFGGGWGVDARSSLRVQFTQQPRGFVRVYAGGGGRRC